MESTVSQGKPLRATARAKASHGGWDEALRAYVESVNAFRQAGEHNEVAFTLAEVADSLNQRGKSKHAAAFYDQALAAAAKTADPAFLAPILRDAGLFFRATGEKDRAFEMLKDGFELFEILKDEWSQAMLAHEVARILAERGQYDEALDWYRRALPLAPEERDADLRMRIYFEMGRAFERRGLRDRAQSCYHNCSLLAKKIFDADYLISSMEQLGHLAFEQGNSEAAKRYLKEAFAMNEGLLTSRRAGAPTDDTDEVYERRKDALVDQLISAYLADPNVTASEKEIAEFLAHLHKRRDASGLAAALSKIAEYFRVRGEHPRAARFFENAAGIFERAGMAYVAAEIAKILGDLYRDRGLPRKAFNRYWKGMNLLEGDHAVEHAALRKRLHERMEALKPGLAAAARGDDEESLAGSTTSAAHRPVPRSGA